jgi:uncharacterized protein
MQTIAAVLFATMALVLCALPQALAASFNCALARLPVERMICSDALLSELDEKLYDAFQTAGGQTSRQIAAEQAQWVRQRNQCVAPTCVSALYRKRIAELSRLSVGEAPSRNASAPVSSPSPPTAAGSSPIMLPPVPTPNDRAARRAEFLLGSIEKFPKQVNYLRSFQEQDRMLRSQLRSMTSEQQEKYSKALDTWWNSALQAIGANGMTLSDVTLLENIASSFPPERAADLRRLAARGLWSGSGPPLTNDEARLPAGGPEVEPSDREVWEGAAPCASQGATYQFVVLGRMEHAGTVYLMWQGDRRAVVRYSARFDPTIGVLDLSGMKTIRSNDFVALPASVQAELKDGASTVVMPISPTCELGLQKKKFPQSVLQALAQARSDPSYVPPRGLPFCVSMIAWSHLIQAGAPGLDLSKGVESDPPGKLLVASAFHDSMTVKFLGRPLTNLDTTRDQALWFEWTKLADECAGQPLYFDDSQIIQSIIRPFLDYLGSKKQDLEIIPAIENRIKLVAQAKDNFSDTEDGFKKLRTYVAPLEAELAPTLTQVRLAVLKPLLDRQAQIAIAATNAEPAAQTGTPRSVDQVTVLADMIDSLKEAGESAEAASAAAKATAIINADT